MKARVLIHNLNHSTLVVDISAVGLPVGVLPEEGEPRTVSALRFRTWRDAEHHLLALGASQELATKTRDILRKQGVAVLTIT